MYLQPVQPQNVTVFQFRESRFTPEENMRPKCLVRSAGFIPQSHNCMLFVFSGQLKIYREICTFINFSSHKCTIVTSATNYLRTVTCLETITVTELVKKQLIINVHRNLTLSPILSQTNQWVCFSFLLKKTLSAFLHIVLVLC